MQILLLFLLVLEYEKFTTILKEYSFNPSLNQVIRKEANCQYIILVLVCKICK